MNNTITLPELITKLAETTSTTKRMSELFMRELFATVGQALANGETVTIKDFGQFFTDDSHNVVFNPSKQISDALNQPFEAFVPVELDDDISEEMLNEIGAQSDSPEITNIESKTAEDAETYGEQDTTSIVDEPEVADLEDSKENEKPDAYTSPALGLSNEISEKQEVAIKMPSPDREKEVHSKRSFLRGVFAGATGILLAGLIGYWIGHHTATRTIEYADTVASQVDSISPEPVAKPIVTDTTSATMYLSRIARKHYGSADFWVYIYEENMAIIDDPNNIPPGTIVVIPPAEKYGIDANDKESIEKARKRSFELFAK